MQETADVTLEPTPDLERGLSASEIAEVFITVLGGANTAEDVIGRLMVDCGPDDYGYWREVVRALRGFKCELELPSAAKFH